MKATDTNINRDISVQQGRGCASIVGKKAVAIQKVFFQDLQLSNDFPHEVETLLGIH
jgi:hypothetical protein